MAGITRPRYPIDYPIQPEHHSPMYLMHKWWARKPHNIMAEYINAYTIPGDIVFDPFMGSGVVPIEAVHLGRRAIGLDVNPMGAFIAENTGKPVNLAAVKDAFQIIKQSCAGLRENIYGVHCPSCGEPGEITHVIFSRSGQTDNVQEIWVKCGRCGVKQHSPSVFSPENNETLQKQQPMNHEHPDVQQEDSVDIPEVQFTYDTGEHFLQLRHSLINEPNGNLLFTNRALFMLGKIHKEISAINDPEIRDLLLFAFSSTLGQASKMVWVIEQRKGKQVKKQVGSWTHHFYWNPDTYFEVNAWNCFEERMRKLFRGKADANAWWNNGDKSIRWQESGKEVVHHLQKVPDFNNQRVITPLPWIRASNPTDIIERHSTIYLGTNAIQGTEISEGGNFQPESVDFILTDPPYGDSIQYYELAKLWNAWLNFSNSPKDEIVINSRQGKNLAKYQEDLQTAFENCYAILKPCRYMVVTFHNNNFNIRNALITAVVSAGFELQHVLFQVPPRRSLKAYLHPLGTPIGDYYIRFYKGTEKANPAPIPEEHLEKTILDIFEDILTNRGEPTPLLWMGNLVDSHFAQAGLFPFPERVKLDEICAFSSRFSIENGDLWFARPRKMNLPLPLSERILQLLYDLFQGKTPPFSREDKKIASWRVMREFSGDLTPDPLVLRDLVQGMENARKLMSQ